MNWTLEVIPVPVSDMDRVKEFSFMSFEDPGGNDWMVQEAPSELSEC
ncbi:hypothetical protein [Streptomyces sp. NPDC053048]